MSTTSRLTSSSSRRCSSLLIVDTDVGFDDLLAIHSIIATLMPKEEEEHQQQQQQTKLLLSTVGGVVDASRGASTLQQLFPQHTIVVGRNSPLIYYNDDNKNRPLPPWLDNYRSHTLDAFLSKMKKNMMCPEEEEETTRTKSTSSSSSHTPKTTTTSADDDAWSKIMSQLEHASDNSVDLLCIGPLTNLAYWLDHDPEQLLASKLHSIYILGGNYPSSTRRGEQQQQPLLPPEFNFSLDPKAAHTVLTKSSSSSSLLLIRNKIHLVTTRGICDMTELTRVLGKQRMDDFIDKMTKTRNEDDDDDTTNNELHHHHHFMRTLFQFDKGAFCLSCDPVCAFLSIMMMSKNQKNNDNDIPTSLLASWEQMSVEVDPSSGLVVPSTSTEEEEDDDDDVHKINIATKVNLEEYWKWMNDIYRPMN